MFEMLSSAGTEAAVMEIGNTVTEVSEKFLIALLNNNPKIISRQASTAKKGRSVFKLVKLDGLSGRWQCGRHTHLCRLRAHHDFQKPP